MASFRRSGAFGLIFGVIATFMALLFLLQAGDVARAERTSVPDPVWPARWEWQEAAAQQAHRASRSPIAFQSLSIVSIRYPSGRVGVCMSCVEAVALPLHAICPLSQAISDARFASGVAWTEHASPP
jgi:hypothetical protein